MPAMPARLPHARCICFLLTWLTACGPAGERAKPAADEPLPPVRGALLIVVDTLRADHVGVYGSGRDLTPHMDALAADALVFRNGIAASSWTRPSIASMFTGQYPTSIAVLDKTDALDDELETVAETLTAAGVVSLGISTNGNSGKKFNFHQGFARFEHRLPRQPGYAAGHPMVPAEEVTRTALELIDGVGQGAAPFFLFAHYTDPHAPYIAHPGLLSEPEPPGRFNGSRIQLDQLDALDAHQRTAEDVDRIRHLYAGEVKYCDVWLGELFGGLESRGLLDDMLVVLTSDHGEGLWDHGARAHGRDLYEEMIQVPLIVRFPRASGIAPATIEAFAHHIDIAPTILGTFGVPLPSDYQGRDLGLAAQRGELDRERGFAYSEMNSGGIDLESASNGRLKLIRDRAYDHSKAGPFEYTLQEGDTLEKVSRRAYGAHSHVPEIRALNPHLPPGVPIDAALEPGMRLSMPARRRPPDDQLFELFELADDPREQCRLPLVSGDDGERLGDILRHFAAENLARSIQGQRISLESLDEETLAELRGLGYLGDRVRHAEARAPRRPRVSAPPALARPARPSLPRCRTPARRRARR